MTRAFRLLDSIMPVAVVAFLTAGTTIPDTPAPPSPRPAVRAAQPMVLPGKPTPEPNRVKFRGRIQTTVDGLSPSSKSSWQQSFDEGQRLYNAGQYDAAYKAWSNTLELGESQNIWEQGSPSEQIETSKQMATVYKTQKQPEGAARMFDHAIRVAAHAFGKDSVAVANLMMQQGSMYTFYPDIKNYSKAEELLNEALRINEKIYGKMSIPAGDVLMIIAQLKEKQHHQAEAAECWQRVIDIGNKLEPGAIACCTIGPRQGLARCYEKLGKYDKAIAVHKELLSMCERGAKDMLPTVKSAYDTCVFNATAKH
jgi:tetratricopeptide (TPR) repeat protein